MYSRILLFITLLNIGSILKAQTIDQSHTGTNDFLHCIIDYQIIGQSFTAGLSGALSKIQIDFELFPCTEPITSYTMTIDIIDGAGYGGTILTTESITVPLPFSRDTLPIIFTSPTCVTSGNIYTIRINPDSNRLCEIDQVFGTLLNVCGVWYFSDSNSYNNGAPYINGSVEPPGYDQYFETFVDTINTNISSDGQIINSSAIGAEYQWLFCGNTMFAIPGENNQSFTPVLNGSYAVEVTEHGCKDTSLCKVITEINSLENFYKKGLQVYPNSTTGHITVFNLLPYRIV